MRHIGFDGGSFLCELGSPADVVTFFRCIDAYAAQKHKGTDYALLTDRLYRRYLRLDELDTASSMMSQVRNIFSGVSSSSVNWKMMGWDEANTWLDLKQTTLADVFAKYFEHFAKCVKSAQVFFNSWNIYQPVKTVIADMPEFMTDKKRPLVQYDALQGEPFWLR